MTGWEAINELTALYADLEDERWKEAVAIGAEAIADRLRRDGAIADRLRRGGAP